MLTCRRTLALLAVLALGLFPVAVIVFNHMGEDCFITFRYAEQWLRGKGLVYNVGDRVEGYSNLLWLLLMAGWKTLGGSMLTGSRWLSVGAHGVLVIVLGFVAMGDPIINRKGRRVIPWHRLWLPVAVWAQPLLHYHCDRGLETVLYAALLAVAMVAVAGRFWLLAGVLAGLAALTRPEGIFYSIALLPMVIWEVDRDEPHVLNALKKPPWRELLGRLALFLAPVAVACGGQTAFRVLYYDSWIPNTLLAKLGRGARPPAWGEIARWVVATNGLPLLAVAGGVYGWIRLPERRRLILAATGLMGAALVYQIGIGNVAAVANRYLIAAIPPALVLTAMLLDAAHEDLSRSARLRAVLPIVVLAGVFFTVSNGDAPRSRFHNRLWEFARHPDWSGRWAWWTHEPVILNAEAGRWLRDALGPKYPGSVLAADQMGALGYFASLDQRMIDLGGLMDREIARRGLQPAEVVRRAPDFLILYALQGEREPILTELRLLVRSTEFQEAYAEGWRLSPRDAIQSAEFIVYAKRSLRNPAEPERILLGPPTEEFERWWRVTER